MNKTLRSGKSSEMIVAGELLRHGLDVYLPCVDDQAIDMIVRVERAGVATFYSIQVKSVAGYNRIIGVRNPDKKSGNYILILHYRHTNKPDEFFYLTGEEIKRHLIKESDWGDLIFNKPQREEYAHKVLSHLACALLSGSI